MLEDTLTDDSLPVINWTARVDAGGHTGLMLVDTQTARVAFCGHKDR